jgi:hypothetical protein
MIRVACAWAALATGLAAVAAPGPKGKDDGLYHPTQVGDRLEYEARSGRAARLTRITEVVTKVEKKDGALLVSVSRDRRVGESAASTFAVSEKGVIQITTAGQDLPVPIPLLKLPAKLGDTWTYEPNTPAGAPQRKTTYTMGKVEEIEVPAGKFKALRVESETDLGDGRMARSTLWYASGVGLVKSVSDIGGTERTQILKAFTRGK